MKIEELTKLSVGDIDLILRDQTDLFSEEELNQLITWREYLTGQKYQKPEEPPKPAKFPVVKCPKCDGPNDSANDTCVYCGYTFKESDYYYPDGPAKVEQKTRNSDTSSSGKPFGRLIAGFALSGGGLLSVLYGYDMNNNFEAQWNAIMDSGSTDPGTKWILLGVIALLIGVVLLTSAFCSKE